MNIKELKEPLAITMWDGSWLRRHYAGGGFESYDKALDELVERGYNAIRIDAFPHMIATAPDGTNADRFFNPAGVGFHWYGFAQWGNPWSVYIYPRRDIVELLKKCEARNVYVLLSTWLKSNTSGRNGMISGPMDHVRIWDETLRFLEENDCLKQVIGVDVQNEIPWGGGYPWMRDQLSRVEDPKRGGGKKPFNEFICNYYKTVLGELRIRWPQMPFSVSYCFNYWEEHFQIDHNDCDFLDIHIWAEDAPFKFLKNTRYEEAIVRFGENMMTKVEGADSWGGKILPPDYEFEKICDEIHESWYKHQAQCEEFLEERIAYVAEKGKQYNIPVGNTEGWGSVSWAQHPMLRWDMIKEAALVAAKLGRKYGYTFNCQSNFCEPHFPGLWNDVAYHKEVTSVIRGLK